MSFESGNQGKLGLRTAIVTGVAEGVGEAVAYRLLEEGLNVVISDTVDNRDSLERISNNIPEKGGRYTAVVCNPSEENDVRKLVDTTLEVFGRLDVVRWSKAILFFVSRVDTIFILFYYL